MKKIFLFAVVALALASCDNNDDNQLTSNNALQVTATIGESILSRAADTSWTVGDRIGISSNVDGIDAPYTNLEYEAKSTDGEFSGKTPMFYYRPMTLTAYYPFAGTEGTAPGNDGVISAVTYADNQLPANQPQIDFLWDSKTNQDQADFSAAEPNVNFTFYHKMSKLTFAFEGSTVEVENENGSTTVHEVKVSDIVKYGIEGLVLDGTFDTATGICSIDNSVEPQYLEISIGKGSIEADGQLLSPLIVFPQKLGNSKVKLHVYTDELENTSVLQHYTCDLTFGGGELEPGNSYKFTIRVSKVGLKLAKMSIEDWNTEQEVKLTATVDGEVKEGGATEDEQK